MTTFTKFKKVCACAGVLLVTQMVNAYAAIDNEADNLGVKIIVPTAVEIQADQLNIPGNQVDEESCLPSCEDSIFSCCNNSTDIASNTCTDLRTRFQPLCAFLSDIAVNPHVWSHIVGIAMIVAGSSMMGTADVTWEESDGRCTDDTRYYDDDYNYNTHHYNRHYHSNTHDCVVTKCTGPGCAEYYGGMTLLIAGSVIVIADWLAILKCDLNGGGRFNNHVGDHREHNVRNNPHHNRGHGNRW
ncbi:MAG: hypothetical protein Q8S21_04180 [Candidatus Paracaedibacteraceae bacterium]|nr:hypothetical protein [Candidatus Paracaedibacteraceae bacterium]